MITLLGQNLIFWTGILAGLFFILTFLGCCCHVSQRFCELKSVGFMKKHHKLFIYLAFILFLLHAGLALIGKFFGVYI